MQWLHEKKHRERKGNRLPPGGMGMGGESCKNCTVRHAGIVRVSEASQGRVTEAALLCAKGNIVRVLILCTTLEEAAFSKRGETGAWLRYHGSYGSV